MRRTLLATVAAAALLPAGAAAQTADDIRTVLTTLKNQFTLAQQYAGDQVQLILGGSIGAAATEGRIRVDYPELLLRLPMERGDERLQITLPSHPFTASVGDEAIELVYAGPYTVTIVEQERYDDMGGEQWEDETVVTAAIGAIAGTQDVSIPDGWTLGLDVVASDILVTAMGQPERVTLESVSVFIDGDERADRRWDIDYALSVDGGDLDSGDPAEVIRWGHIGQQVELTALSLDQALAWNATVAEMVEARAPEHEVAQALVDLLFGDEPLAQGFTVASSLADLEIDQDGTAITLGDIGYGFGMSGMGGSTIDMALDLAVDGWTSSDVPPETFEVAPQTVRLALSADAVPVRNLIADAEAALRDGMDPAPLMMGTLMNSAASVTVEEVFIVSPLTTLSGAGELRTEPTAMMGAVGTFEFWISGLSDAIAYLAASDMPDADDAVAALTLLQSLGQEMMDGETGEPYRQYRMELTAQGQVLLNGTDFLPLLETL